MVLPVFSATAEQLVRDCTFFCAHNAVGLRNSLVTMKMGAMQRGCLMLMVLLVRVRRQVADQLSYYFKVSGRAHMGVETAGKLGRHNWQGQYLRPYARPLINRLGGAR